MCVEGFLDKSLDLQAYSSLKFQESAVTSAVFLSYVMFLYRVVEQKNIIF